MWEPLTLYFAIVWHMYKYNIIWFIKIFADMQTTSKHKGLCIDTYKINFSGQPYIYL